MAEYQRKAALGLVLLALAIAVACRPTEQKAPVTLTFSGNLYWQRGEWKQRIDAFTRETGISVRLIPFSDEAEDTRRVQYMKWLSSHATTPDVYQADVSFIGAIAGEMLDLTPYAPDAAREHMPNILKNYVIDGRLVALPFHTDVGLLYYRTDLLHKYGYAEPPQTWDELETMARNIQNRERAAGRSDFWGYVWEGSPANEGLTAIALEWQVSNGGGHIIEADRTITVNNRFTIAVLNRARRWINTISPPGSSAYGPGDVGNVWLSGRAAFMRNWPEFIERSDIKDQGTFAVCRMPAGPAGPVGTLGGWQFSVPKYSKYPKEAVRFIRFLTGFESQTVYARHLGRAPSREDLYQALTTLGLNPRLAGVHDALFQSATPRPSNVAGGKYPEVSAAYAKAVHSVLTGEREAGAALADLEKELVLLTGFPARQHASMIPNDTAEHAH